MGKYNLCATKEDWENLYKEVKSLGFDVKHFKKSQSFDSALVQLDIMKDKKEDEMEKEILLQAKDEFENNTCCLCGLEFIGWGNNPYPLKEDTDDNPNICCNDCNYSKVVPARIEEIMGETIK